MSSYEQKELRALVLVFSANMGRDFGLREFYKFKTRTHEHKFPEMETEVLIMVSVMDVRQLSKHTVCLVGLRNTHHLRLLVILLTRSSLE